MTFVFCPTFRATTHALRENGILITDSADRAAVLGVGDSRRRFARWWERASVADRLGRWAWLDPVHGESIHHGDTPPVVADYLRSLLVVP